MKITHSFDIVDKVQSFPFIFVDNDFLGQIFRDQALLDYFYDIFGDRIMTIDQHVWLEFLRDSFSNKLLVTKQQFINNADAFDFPTIGNDIYFGLQKNALILSRIYAFQRKIKENHKSSNASPTDLMLAARIMNHPDNSILITGNKKDYSSCIFDLLGVISYEKSGGEIISYSIISFNKTKFETCFSQLEEYRG